MENQRSADHGGLGSQHDYPIKRPPPSHDDQQDEPTGSNAGEERWNELRIRPFRKEQVAKSLVFPVAEDHKSKSEGASDELGCGFHDTWTPSPRSFGHSFHAHLDRQSERSDAGLHC